jgi:hypothetical protein
VCAVDDKVLTKVSAEYTGIDAGGTYEYSLVDRKVLQSTVKQQLAVVVQLFEWDRDQDPNPVSSAADYSYQLAQGVISGGGTVGAIAGAFVLLLSIVGLILEEFENPDNLGQQKLGWSSEDLIRQTQTPDQTMRGQLRFNNSDATGTHVLDYEVLRTM